MSGLVDKINLSSERSIVDINKVVPDIGQPRRKIEHNKIQDLTESLKAYGQFTYPLVEIKAGSEIRNYIGNLEDVDESDKQAVLEGMRDDENYYFLVVGHRRFLAAKNVPFREMEVDVLKNNLSLLERRLVQIDEDSQLALTPWRKAEEIVNAYHFENRERGIDGRPGITIKELSAYVSHSENTVRDAMRYVGRCSRQVKRLVESGDMSYEKAVLLSWIPSKEEQYEFALKHGKASFESLKKKVRSRVFQIADAEPEIAQKHGLLHMIRAVNSNEKDDYDFFSTGAIEKNYRPHILEKRGFARTAKNEVYRYLKLCSLDEEYAGHIQSVLEEKVERFLAEMSALGEEVRKHTTYMDDFNNRGVVNGKGVRYDTIGDSLRAIEEDERAPVSVINRKNRTKKVNIGTIYPDPKNPRGPVTEEEIEDLATAIKRDGRLLNPVLVEKTDNDYVLVCGHRRLEACRRAGLKKIPAIELQHLDPKLRLWLQRQENMQVPFTASERARALSQVYDLADSGGVDDLIEIMSISRQTGLNELKYEKEVCREVKILVEEGLMPFSSALLFTNKNLRVEDMPLNPEQQLDIAYTAVLTGKTSKKEIRESITGFIDSIEMGKKQQRLFDIPIDRQAVYRKQAEEFGLTLLGLSQTISLWSGQEEIVRNVISRDVNTMTYLCTIAKMLSDARPVKRKNKAKRRAKK